MGGTSLKRATAVGPNRPKSWKVSKGNGADRRETVKEGREAQSGGHGSFTVFHAPPTLCLIILPNYSNQGKESKTGGQETGVNPYLVLNVQPDTLTVSEYLGWA